MSESKKCRCLQEQIASSFFKRYMDKNSISVEWQVQVIFYPEIDHILRRWGQSKDLRIIVPINKNNN